MSYERQPIADHAINLASTIQGNLKRSLEAIGVVCRQLPPVLGCPMPCVGGKRGPRSTKGDAWEPVCLSEGGLLD